MRGGSSYRSTAAHRTLVLRRDLFPVRL